MESRTLLAGTVTSLANFAPNASNTMMLETDGTVLMQGGNVSNNWYRLTPDAKGSYVNGTWSQAASMGLQRLYYGSNVLPDGRVFVQGGEYSGPYGLSNFTNTGEIYDPTTNSWSKIANFPQGSFGDDPTEVLPNGNILAGYISGAQTYLYNPTNNTWSPGGTKLRGDRSDEEAWVKLPDNSILSYDIFASNNSGIGSAQRYVPSTNTWVDAGILPVLLSSSGDGDELGPGFLLPDGRAFYLGANGHTAYYTPSTNSWTAGFDIPNGLGADDAPGAELPDGKILFTADKPLFNGPAHLFEFDPTATTSTSAYTDLTSLLPSGFLGGPSFVDRMLVLPSGQVLINNGGSRLVVYTPDLPPIPSSTPTISSVAEAADGSFTLTGTGLNGISEGAAYGDDAEMSTNYPIVTLTDSNNNVYFARTYGWSSLVATGPASETTKFTLPVGLPASSYTLRVVANGSPSSPFNFSTPTNPGDPAPTFALAASATPNPDPGTTVNLSSLGADVLGESTLTYNWATLSVPSGAAYPSFSTNGTNAAKNDVATFSRAGSYTFQVTATNLAGLSSSSTVTVTVTQTFTSVAISPTPVNVNPNSTRQIVATGLDQFGLSLASQPHFTFTLTSGNGSVNGTGLYTAPGTGTLATVTATSGALSGVASVYVLTPPLLTQDIGGPIISGAAGDDSNGHFTLLGAGTDIFGTSDQFRFAYTTLTGPGTLIARVTGEQNTSSSAKAGVMFRNSLAANDLEAFMAITPGAGATFQSRATAGDTTVAVTKAGPKAPYWVKLVRDANNLFSGYYSPDGVAWTLLGSATIAMGSTVDVGLALTSRDQVALNTSTFDNVSLDAPPTVASGAVATPNPDGGKTTNLSVLGADLAGESNLTYTWSTTSLPTGATTPTFSLNGTNAAKNDVATFYQAGNYTFTARITNLAGLATTSSVNVTVTQTLTSIAISPTSATVPQGGTQPFAATAFDQFGNSFATPPTFTYSVVSDGAGGTIDQTGLYTAPSSGFGVDTVDVSAGPLTTSATVTVTQAPIITTAPTSQSVIEGQTATFTAAAIGYPTPTVQWYVSTDGIHFSPVPGATNPTLSFAALLSQDGSQYEAVFTNSVGSATTTPVLLSVSPQVTTVGAVSAGWGTSGSAPLFTAGDGLRLLPAGRVTDLPWLNINQVTVTLNQAETLAPGDVTVTGITVANYGPVTISPASGSNSTYLITLAVPISAADRVTLSIGNLHISSFVRRLDVLPGDVNDDGFVTSADVSAVYANIGTTYVFADILGDGVDSTKGMRQVRLLNGTTLPLLS